MPRGRTGRVCDDESKNSGRRLLPPPPPPPVVAPSAPPTLPPPPSRVPSSTTTTVPHPVPRGRSRGSPVWLYFRFETEDRRRTMCSLCGHSMAWDPHTNSTSNMLKHIRNKHPAEHRHAYREEGRHVAVAATFLHNYAHFRRALPTGDDGGGGSGGNDYSHNNGDEAEGGVGSASSPVDQYQGGGGGGDGSERDPTPAPPTPTHQKPESYQLRHNNHLTLVLEALARDESFMDVTLTAQGRSLKAHKSVLSAVSPYFRGVLRDNPCQHPIIIMPRDVRFEELYSIVNYIYKGEMTVAAEDLTSLLKTAEILQVSGLAPSDSTATLNPSHQESSVTGNPRSSSTSSSASSTSAAPPAPRPRPTKQTPQGQRRVSTPPPRPKSGDSSINPTDFMDVDMTCVKEEVTSGGEEDDGGEEQISKLQCPQSSPGDDLQHTADALHEAFSLPFDQNLQQPLPSTSSSSSSTFHQSSTASTTEALDPSAPSIKSDPDHNMNPQPCTGTIENAHPFRCPHCEEQHRDMDTLLTHLRLRHPTKPSFTCGCGRVFTRQTYQQAHSKLCPNAT